MDQLRPGGCDLSDGTVHVEGGGARLLVGDCSLAFGFDGWHPPVPRPRGDVEVLTPPASALALANGFVPLLHPSVR